VPEKGQGARFSLKNRRGNAADYRLASPVFFEVKVGAGGEGLASLPRLERLLFLKHDVHRAFFVLKEQKNALFERGAF
jgi:hypothetical protein